MARYDVKYACGCERTVNLYGKAADRERKVEWLATQICPDCLAKMAAEQMKEDAAANDFPELVGTPKQIEWAMTIRHRIIENNYLLDKLNREPYNEGERKMQIAIAELLTETSAKWWIENRNGNLRSTLGDMYNRAISKEEKTDAPAEPETAETDSSADSTAILAPEGSDTALTVEIAETESTITVATPERNEKMAGMIRKRMRGKWDKSDRVWVVPPEGSHRADRITEIASVSLAEGYRVKIPAEYAERVKAGEYRPATSRRITVATLDGYYCITWDRSDDDFYKIAKRLPSAQWNSVMKVVKVNPRYYDEVKGFAEMYAFEISDAAMEAMNRARAEAEKEEVISVTPTVNAPSMPEPSAKPQKIEVPEVIDIDDELRDDD